MKYINIQVHNANQNKSTENCHLINYFLINKEKRNYFIYIKKIYLIA